MTRLNFDTLAVVFTVISLTLAFFLFIMRAITPRYRGMNRWIAGDACVGGGFFLLISSPIRDFFWPLIPNAITLLGLAFIGAGTWAFIGGQRKFGLLVYASPIAFALVGGALVFSGAPDKVGPLFSLLIAVHFFFPAITLLLSARYKRRGGFRITAISFSILTLFFGILSSTRGAGHLYSDELRNLTVLFMTVGIICWSFGFMLMTSSRLVDELSEHEQESSRRERDHLVKTIIDMLPQSIVLKDRESRYLVCNASFSRNIGKMPEELLGSDDSVNYSADRAARYRSDDVSVMESGETREVCERIGEDGQEIWIDVIKTPVKDEFGDIQGVLEISTDVTKRRESEVALRQSERRYRELSAELEHRVEQRTKELREAKRDIDLFFDVTVEYLCLNDLEGHFLKLSPSWSRALGWREDELVGKSIFEMVHPDDREATMSVGKELSRGERVVGFQNRFRKADGGWIWLSWATASVPSRGLIIAAAHDITARVETEERLRAAREEAERASKSKTQFIATMSHELRTPLNAVLGYCTLLENIVRDERGQGYLKSIGSAGRALLAIINDLLDLVRAESGRIELAPVPFDPRRLLDELSDIFRFSAAEKGLRLEFRITERMPKTILMDSARLRQVLINLIGNAVKFTETGSVTVSMDAVLDELTSSKDDPNATRKATVKIEVVDTGIGIASEYRSRLFESFSQQDALIARRYGGVGLGLAIAKRLLDLMGGNIRYEAPENGGSCFRIELPGVTVAGAVEEALSFVTPAPNVAKETAPPAWASTAPSATEGEKKLYRILVVDDNEENRSLIDQLFTSRSDDDFAEENFEVVCTADGETALELAGAADLILLDVMMPGINGYDVCRSLKTRRETAHIPVIMVTALADRESLVEGFLAGAADYVTKPFDAHELRMRARTQLELKRARVDLENAYSELSSVSHEVEEKNAKLQSLMSRLDYVSMTDELTSLANRQAISARLSEEILRSARSDSPISLLIGDLDRFKSINDRFGHQTGDAALAECARRFAESLREADVVGRWGGAEFLAILPDTSLEEAMRAAERVRAHLTEDPIARGPESFRATISIGVASLVPSASDSVELVSGVLIRAADDALYRAKTKGRDRVECVQAAIPSARPILPSARSSPL